TRFSRDWSSDVCSSDLPVLVDFKGGSTYIARGRLEPRDGARFRQIPYDRLGAVSIQRTGSMPQLTRTAPGGRHDEENLPTEPARSEERRVGKERIDRQE